MRTLLDLVAERGRLSVADATAALGVSEATVRRDFAALADQQLVTRTHGGRGGVVGGLRPAGPLPQRWRAT